VSVRPAFLWRVAASDAFEIRHWDGDVVLYAMASGETHALSPAHSASLLTLLDQPDLLQPAAFWLAAMSAGEAPDARPDSQDAADLEVLAKVLTDLHDIGVVERVSA
jgi:hypothetical protein